MTHGTIKRTAVLGVGMGAVGAPAAAALIHRLEPYTTLCLVDRGEVAARHLPTTHLFTPAYTGRSKVDAVAAALRGERTGVRIAPVHAALETLGAGPFLHAQVVFAALDNRAAKFRWNRFAQAGGAPALLAEAEGDGSPAGRVRFWHAARTRRDGPCLECGWGEADYAALAAEGARAEGNAPAAPPHPQQTAALAEEMARLVVAALAGDSPLAPGEERRFLGGDERLTLRTEARRDCLCPHGRPDPLLRMSGAVGPFSVADLIAAVDGELGATRWMWRLPAPVRPGRCEDCGAATGWTWPGGECPAACPVCRSPRILRGNRTGQLGRAELLPLAPRPLVSLWPAGDILDLRGADGRRRLSIALPADDLWDWLCRPALPNGGTPCRS